MIEVNLIPDVKQAFIRAQKMRNMAITLAIVIGVTAGGVVALLALFLGGQAITETVVRDNIKKDFKTFQSIDNIENVLTIQNQLSKISDIHQNKSIDSRVFDLLAAINPPAPNDIKISNIKLDPETKNLTIEGSAVNGYPATETFRKTILNTKLESGSGDDLSSVTLTDKVIMGETSYGEGANGGKVLRFSLSFTYPEGLFDNTLQSIKVVTPTNKIDVTDSRTRVPDSLFSQQAKDTTEGN
ncbi:hypothetical protein IPM09_04090 [Candidatus Saccharibacteria bacterium]|nr:MAG: hypothetical protein IPM09_04090 [Candidatus Saccharibacteria bacterium]